MGPTAVWATDAYQEDDLAQNTQTEEASQEGRKI